MKIFQRGFSLISAIFLLVVLAFLGVAMTTFSVNQNQSSAMDVMGSRAYHAARAGIEWAAYNVSLTPLNSPAAAACANVFAQGTLGGSLAPFTVTVTCPPPVKYTEGASTIWIYEVTSTATAGGAAGNPDYVERAITVKLGQ